MTNVKATFTKTIASKNSFKDFIKTLNIVDT